MDAERFPFCIGSSLDRALLADVLARLPRTGELTHAPVVNQLLLRQKRRHRGRIREVAAVSERGFECVGSTRGHGSVGRAFHRAWHGAPSRACVGVHGACEFAVEFVLLEDEALLGFEHETLRSV